MLVMQDETLRPFVFIGKLAYEHPCHSIKAGKLPDKHPSHPVKNGKLPVKHLDTVVKHGKPPEKHPGPTGLFGERILRELIGFV